MRMKTWLNVTALILLILCESTLVFGVSKSESVATWTFDRASAEMPWTPLVETKMAVLKELTDSYDLVVMVVPHNTTSLNTTDSTATMLMPMPATGYDKVFDIMLRDRIKSMMRVMNGDEGDLGRRLLVVELPDDNNKDDESHDCAALGRKVASSVVAALHAEKDTTGAISSCAIVLRCSKITTETFLSECSSSILTGLYSDIRFKGKLDEETKPMTNVDFIAPWSDEVLSEPCAIHRGMCMAKGVYLAKDIVNAPHNCLNSFGLAATAKKMAAESGGHLSCQILETADCEKRSMGAFLGVARGSETHPKLIHLTYRPRKKGTKKNPLRKLGIVGKGLLFDTGGYNIKTSMMELMKFDCGGAAAVFGAAQAIAALKPEGVEVHFVVAACENMINERAVVPGDVLTASNGKTIEVMNTDAEGRLTMADALVYVDKEVGCERIIELSTLTGACIGALGSAMSGIWTDDETLLEELKAASRSSGEKLWHMPLEKEYNEQIKSKVADLKNIGGRYGGAITAALFLTHFIENKPFAHIDMAGPVWNTKLGATGWGAKLVTEWVFQNSNNVREIATGS